MIVPQVMHTHAMRRALRVEFHQGRVEFNEHRTDVRSFGCNGHGHRESDSSGQSWGYA